MAAEDYFPNAGFEPDAEDFAQFQESAAAPVGDGSGWATFEGWNAAGYRIRKGEKSGRRWNGQPLFHFSQVYPKSPATNIRLRASELVHRQIAELLLGSVVRPDEVHECTLVGVFPEGFAVWIDGALGTADLVGEIELDGSKLNLCAWSAISEGWLPLLYEGAPIPSPVYPGLNVSKITLDLNELRRRFNT